MKKLFAIILAVFIVATFAACCEAKSAGDTGISDGGDTPAATDTKGYAFTFSGVKLYVGEEFNATSLPEAQSVSQTPSCAIDGTDDVYNYGTFELTVFNDGSKGVIYSIYILDANTPTDEGLYLGDDLTHLETIYGIEYVRNGDEVVFQKGESKLIFILQDDIIISIEFRMAS